MRIFGALILMIGAAAIYGLQAAAQNADVAALVDRGNQLADAKKFDEAMGAFRQADALANHACADCYLGMVKVESSLGQFPEAIADARRAATAAGDDGIMAAEALTMRANLLVATSGGAADPKWSQAESDYRQALVRNPKKSAARFALGVMLLQAGRDADGVAELKAYVNGPFANPRYVDRANRLIADPSRARALPSEDFLLATIDGEKISKASLRGQVVLLDFWGSWCPPCRESIPIMADLHDKFSKGGFQLVGINTDPDEKTLRSFASTHGMNWPEFLDIDGQIEQLFEIRGFPTYVVLARDGTIAYQETGLGDDTEEKLNQVITRELAKSFVATPAPSAPVAPAAVVIPAPVAAEPAAVRLPGTPIALVMPPEDVGDDEVSTGLYRNAFLGLTYKFPAQWNAASAEVLDQLNRRRADEMKAAGSSLAAGPDGTVQVAFPQIVFEASPDERAQMPSVMISIAQSGDAAMVGAAHEVEDLKLQAASVASPPRAVMIGKRSFVRTDFQQRDGKAFVARFEASVGQKYLVTLELRGGSKQELDGLVSSAQTLTISKP